MTSKGLAGETEVFARYGVTDRFELGIGYLKKQDIVRPLASYVLVFETPQRPSLTAGMMVDSLEDGRQMVFLSAGKAFPIGNGLAISGYAGIAQVTTRAETRFIGGVVFPLKKGLNFSLQYDGKFLNPGLVAHVGDWNGARVHVGIVAARGERYGLLVAIGMPLGKR